MTLGTFSGTTTGLTMSATTTTITASTIYSELSNKISVDGNYITDYIVANFSGNTSANHGQWFVMGEVPTSGTSGQTSSIEEVSPLTGLDNASNNNNKEWYNVLCNTSGSEVYSYLFVYNSGTSVFDVTKYTYNGTLNTAYDGQIVLAFRPRGSYNGQTLNLETTTDVNFQITGTGITTNPLAEFTVGVTGSTSGAKSFTCSMDTTSSKYVTKVFGVDVYDKLKSEVPIYVYESYPNYLVRAYEQGYIRGLSLTEVYETEGNNFLTSWDTPMTPTVVSEVRGGEVDDLFDVITVSDGESANFEVKVSLINIIQINKPIII